MKKTIDQILRIADILLIPFIYPAAWLLKLVRRAGVYRLPNCRNAFMQVGVFPIRSHYYEPQFDHRDPQPAFSQDRHLPGIEWNLDDQLEMLAKFNRCDEVSDIPHEKTTPLRFHFSNGEFESGDAEYWYQLVRAMKPKRIFEIGSGNSTLLAIDAINRNRADDPDYACEHICIEPYEMPWLEEAGVTVVRKKVEDVELSFFSQLQENDILFIDSSHMIRPQGDVLFEYLELLPSLNKGVIVHVHDIFSPRNYPNRWLEEDVRFWNEQYLLEAFLSHNSHWQIIGALNYLHHHHFEALRAVAPHLTTDRDPGSFYMQKIT
jgi:hypothetical protein